ncbi:MAG: hypothetical protein SP1CHLAM54_15780 [Chlamydiia bacterium]|nr:hypothetical protein [Chlamydiia bacterium]MCH9616467.1 hypothetical protein [Chlamydiia bacterium]MCH9629547.1 hypothetical protein [Chlamydiia bacterium]
MAIPEVNVNVVYGQRAVKVSVSSEATLEELATRVFAAVAEAMGRAALENPKLFWKGFALTQSRFDQEVNTGGLPTLASVPDQYLTVLTLPS